MKYQVLVENTLSELENKVTHLLGQGWRCQGGIAISEYVDTGTAGNPERFICAQAMILEANPGPITK